MSKPWTYEGYWSTVIGDGYEVESDTRQGLDEWLGHAEADAWAAGGQGGELPNEWRTFHERALDALVAMTDPSVSRWNEFKAAYRAGLLMAITNDPEAYGYGPDKALQIADKMLTAMENNRMMVNYDGNGFKLACKALGIKFTRKAIFAYLDGQ